MNNLGTISDIYKECQTISVFSPDKNPSLNAYNSRIIGTEPFRVGTIPLSEIHPL